MAILFLSGIDPAPWWREQLKALVPEEEFRVWPDLGEAADIEFALVWEPPSGLLATLPNLRAIFSLGAGVDHLFRDPDLPRQLPMTRVIDANMTERMTEFVLLHVLRHHRQHDAYAAQQRRAEWRERHQPAAADRRVGVMGLGELGGAAARALAALNFDVAGYSRTPRDIDGVACLHGADALAPFLARSDILVCLLPLTAATAGILGAPTFAALPEGAYVINVARGAHLVEEDLLAALDSGHLSGAMLDVFDSEPLAADHPFWDHPGITVTPHIASTADPRYIAGQIADNIARARADRPLLHAVDPEAGY